MSVVTTLTSPSATLVPMLTSLRESMTTYTVQVRHEGGRLSFQGLTHSTSVSIRRRHLETQALPTIEVHPGLPQVCTAILVSLVAEERHVIQLVCKQETCVRRLSLQLGLTLNASYPASHRRVLTRGRAGRG